MVIVVKVIVVMVTLVKVTLVMVTLVMVTLVMVLVVMVLLTVKQVLLVVSLCYKWRHRCGHSDSCEQSSDPSPVSIYIPISIQYTTTRSIKLSMYLTAQ